MDTTTAKKWLHDYFELYRDVLFLKETNEKLVSLKELFQKTQSAGKKIIFVGNGGSAAMASHCAVDFTKNAGIRCINFNEADLITCFANDFGYEHVFAKAIEHYGDKGDVVVLISSSGKSPNILAAADYARSKGYTLVTFSGFSTDNPLYAKGELNFCVPSRAYNIIEMTHHIWLLAVCDLIIGKAEYPASQPPKAARGGGSNSFAVGGGDVSPQKAMTHHIWLLAVCDLIIGKAEYPARKE